MGLIKAAIGALGGTLGDTWKEAIHCPTIDNTIVVANGVKMHDGSDRSSNTKGTENFISNGSAIMVEENTCMLTLDNGKITNVVTEPGRYILDNSSAPSIFAGQIKDSAKDLISRFTFGGTPSVEQRVIYINLQKLPGIPFGTGTPVPYPDPRYNTTVDLRFYGTFEIQIPDAEAAVKFYSEVVSKGVASNQMTVKGIFANDQYKNEFMQALMVALNGLSAENVSYNQITGQLMNLTEKTRVATEENWASRGFTLTNIGLGPITISDESKELLKDRLKADTMLGSDVQRAMMTGAVARGIEAAGSNENGSMMGFMGMNMAMNVGGNVLGDMPAATQTTSQPAPNGWTCTACGATGNTGAFCSGCGAKKAEPWTCSCGTQNMGKFCSQCGQSKEGDAPAAPTPAEWTCECGTTNKGKFCSNCGNEKPAAPKKYKCDKCGWVPEDPENPPKFCPECGDPFNEDDLV
ncbi:MAG: SPFH domain-containing protein [Eubacterium sp.]|nr:SPFH domain-containing protein [Eubacterium sp.]